MKNKIAIKSSSFSLCKAIKEEAEKLGVQYISEFNEFKENGFYSKGGLFFSPEHFGTSNTNTPMMSLTQCWTGSGVEEFTLPQDWDKALQHIREWVEFVKSNKLQTIQLTFEYKAEIHKDKVIVGCQTIPKEKIEEILDIMSKLK